jgi:hypothetical protein
LDRRSFWTKRRKSVTSLVATLALMLGIAVAYKLFDQTVPNNVVRDASSFDYLVLKMDPLLNETTFTPATTTNPIFFTSATGPDMYPGDTRTVDVKIENNNVPERDATFYVYIDNVRVFDRSSGTPVAIASTDARWGRFVSWWTFSVDKQLIVSSVMGDVTSEEPMVRYGEACSGGLREITKNSPCELGNVNAAGSQTLLEEPTDERLYEFNVSEADDGTDQSAFKAWEVSFDLIFSARLPAVPEDAFPIGDR